VSALVSTFPAQMDRANKDWGANCGPGALAAIMGMTLDEVRPHMGDFESKRYTNPSLMNAALRSIGRSWRKIGAEWPVFGLARIQWEGPWTAQGVPMAARYRHTHWVGSHIRTASHGVFDINALANGTGWCSLDDWRSEIVPWILKELVPRANGAWHVTHGIEIAPSHPGERHE
jgi:hypothetical protein